METNSKSTPFLPSGDLTYLYRSGLIDLIPDPAVVYLRTEDKILFANKQFLAISSYSLAELQKIKLSALVPDDPDTNPSPGESRPVLLQVASGELIMRLLQIHSFSATNQVVVLVFSAPEEQNLFRQDLLDQEFRFDNHKLLTTIAEQSSIPAVFRTAADIISHMIDTEVLITYQKSGSILKKTQIEGNGELFPENISLEQLSRLNTTNLWRTGKPAQNVLEDFAEEAEFAFLVSIPILINENLIGLFLAGGPGSVPDNETLRYFSLLGSHASSTIKQLSTIDNARQTLRNIRHLAHIQQNITDNMTEGILILTPDLRISELNPAAENMLGYASREVFQQKADMVLIGNETLSTLYKSAQQGIPTIVGHNLNLNNRSGSSFPAQILCLPVMEGEVVKSIVLLLRDLSQSEKIRAHSQQLEQRAFLGEVSAIFAHEVKNPINSISTGLQLIGLQMGPDAPYANLVDRLQNDCQRLTHLVKSTLTFSKPVEYQIQAVDLAEMIPSILDRWGPRMTRLNINYNFSSPPEKLLIKADPRAIEQVFVNLISNAIQAMEETGGSLNVKIGLADPKTVPPQCEIIIADSGPGIPEDLVDHVFEPFLTTKASGTGLGLAITKRIVSAHEGNIFIESFPGGTMFHVLLPKVE